MYEVNYLACKLRAASVGREEAVFAVLDNGAEHSYGAFYSAANRMAAALIEKGLSPGDRVAVQVEKSIEALQLYIATVLAGGVFLPLNTAYTAAEISYFLGDAEPHVFICDPQQADKLSAVCRDAGVCQTLTLGAEGEGTLVALAEQQVDSFDAVARSSDDLAAILYTSGTTGRSKGAMLTHANLASNSAALKEYWQFDNSDVLIHALPIFHTHGLFVATNITLTAGSSLVFMPKFDADKVMQALPQATVLMGVPTFYVRLLAHADLNAERAKNIRLFVSGSAPLLAETHERWHKLTGQAILERYGMTETNMNTSNPYDGERRAGTVGYPLPGVELRITDGEKVLAAGEIGAIEVRGPNVFKGYWRMPEKTAEELRSDGFFITGDLGVIDDQGYVSIVGRSKDLIISGGYNIYPKEVESLLDEVEGVDESAVFGLPHPDFGEGVAASIVLMPGVSSEQVLLKIQAALSSDLARFKQPKKIYFADELPRNAMGKVQKKLLRDEHVLAFK